MLGKLMRIQTEVKAPKSLHNSFGNFNYRSAEAICEAVKPFLRKEECSLLLSNEIVEVGGRVYVRATATLYDNETGKSVSVSAMARECAEKKGMDESQITGSASSYARKYALNGLLLLDDTKDADTDEQRRQSEMGSRGTQEDKKQEDKKQGAQTGRKPAARITPAHVEDIRERCIRDGLPEEKVLWLYKVGRLEDMTEEKYDNATRHWDEVRRS